MTSPNAGHPDPLEGFSGHFLGPCPLRAVLSHTGNTREGPPDTLSEQVVSAVTEQKGLRLDLAVRDETERHGHGGKGSRGMTGRTEQGEISPWGRGLGATGAIPR